MIPDILSILIISTIAGLGTGLGGMIVLVKRPSKKSLGLSLGFATGVMVTVAFLQLLAKTWQTSGWFIATVAFMFGALLMFAIDVSLPHIHFNLREGGMKSVKRGFARRKLLRTGMLLAIGIAIHHFLKE